MPRQILPFAEPVAIRLAPTAGVCGFRTIHHFDEVVTLVGSIPCDLAVDTGPEMGVNHHKLKLL